MSPLIAIGRFRAGRARTPCAPSPGTATHPKLAATRSGAQRGARPTSPRSAFTLVEILVTISLLSFIVLGLFAMFSQVQRAFKMSMTQVDMLEAGRAVTEMLPREIEQVTPARLPYPNGVNFYVCIRPEYTGPLLQPLPGTSLQRANVLQDQFILLRDNQTWIGIGYCVRVADPTTGRLALPQIAGGRMGVGALYRWTASTNVMRTDAPYAGLPSDPSQLFLRFLADSAPGSAAISNRVCDGVIHFCFRAFNTNGYFINQPLRAATDVIRSGIAPGEIGLYRFCSNAVPAAVEMELGILDQHSWERYSSIGDLTARLAYVQRPEVTSRIQIFRQRIPVRNVDPLAYQ
jgi:hypothetical protein